MFSETVLPLWSFVLDFFNFVWDKCELKFNYWFSKKWNLTEMQSFHHSIRTGFELRIEITSWSEKLLIWMDLELFGSGLIWSSDKLPGWHIVMWLVRLGGTGVVHIHKVKLRWARLVLGLVTTFGGSTVPVFFRPVLLTWPGRPSVGSWNEYWQWFWSPLGKKWWVLHSSGLCHQNCSHTG